MRITLTPYTPLPYLDFTLNLCVFTPYSHHHFILLQYIRWFLPPPFFFRLDYVSFFTAPFGIFFSLSQCHPFQLSLTLPFYCLRVQLVFSHLQSHHFISSLLFSKYFFLTTIPDEGPSPRRRIIKIFSLNLHISHLDH